MKKIDHNYWIEEYTGKDADERNPDLRIAMQKLYGHRGFDFGHSYCYFEDKDKKNHCKPDGYSTYTNFNCGEKIPYGKKISFIPEVVENNKELACKCY